MFAPNRRQVNFLATQKHERSRKPGEFYGIAESCSLGRLPGLPEKVCSADLSPRDLLSKKQHFIPLNIWLPQNTYFVNNSISCKMGILTRTFIPLSFNEAG
jgi:hypothetical protein